MINNLKKYIYDKDFKLIMTNNSLNIINYISITTLTDDYIEIKTNENLISITGNNLVLNKLLNQEILIIGNIKKIEVF